MEMRVTSIVTLFLGFFATTHALTPLLDYIIPIWPSVSCSAPAFDPPLCGTTSAACQSPTPSAQLALYFAQVQSRVAACPNFFYFTAQYVNFLLFYEKNGKLIACNGSLIFALNFFLICACCNYLQKRWTSAPSSYLRSPILAKPASLHFHVHMLPQSL